jgi:hypothetical protein
MTHLLQNVFELDSFEELSSCVAQCLKGNPNAVSKVTVASAMAAWLVGRLRKRAAAKQNKNKQQPQPQPQQQKQKQWQQSKGKKPAETTVAVKKEVTKKDKKKSTKPTVLWHGVSAGAGAAGTSERGKEKKILKQKSVTSLHKNKKYDGYYKAFKGFKKGATVKK